MRIYLDHNATTRMDPRVRAAMLPWLGEEPGNPSSIHTEGRRAREAVEQARRAVAALIGGAGGQVVFTSGGTEADWLGIVGAARAARAAGRPARVVTSPLEHPAVHGAMAALAAEGFTVETVAVDGQGRIDFSSLRARGPVALASFALANHELGNLYALPKVDGLLHCDAVQAVGKTAVDCAALGVDLLSLSAHKLGGPKGVGALWVRRGVEIEPVAGGGHQERGLRAGTENVPGIVGLGEAARLCQGGAPHAESWARVAALRDRLEAGAVALGARVHGDVGARVGNTSNLGWAGVPGEVLVEALDLEGVAVSTGAACTSGSVAASPVLLGLGMARRAAAEAVRFSLGASTTLGEIERVLSLLPVLVERIRAAEA